MNACKFDVIEIMVMGLFLALEFKINISISLLHILDAFFKINLFPNVWV